MYVFFGLFARRVKRAARGFMGFPAALLHTIPGLFSGNEARLAEGYGLAQGRKVTLKQYAFHRGHVLAAGAPHAKGFEL